MSALSYADLRAWAEKFHRTLCEDTTIPDTSKAAFLKEMLFLLSLAKSPEDMQKALETTSKALDSFRLILERLNAAHEALENALSPEEFLGARHIKRGHA